MQTPTSDEVPTSDAEPSTSEEVPTSGEVPTSDEASISMQPPAYGEVPTTDAEPSTSEEVPTSGEVPTPEVFPNTDQLPTSELATTSPTPSPAGFEYGGDVRSEHEADVFLLSERLAEQQRRESRRQLALSSPTPVLSVQRRHLRSQTQGKFADDKAELSFGGKDIPLRLHKFARGEELQVLREQCPDLLPHLKPIFGNRFFNNLVQSSKKSWACGPPCPHAEKARQFETWVPDKIKMVLSQFMLRLESIWNRTSATGAKIYFGQVGLLFHPKESRFQVFLCLYA